MYIIHSSHFHDPKKGVFTQLKKCVADESHLFESPSHKKKLISLSLSLHSTNDLWIIRNVWSIQHPQSKFKSHQQPPDQPKTQQKLFWVKNQNRKHIEDPTQPGETDREAQPKN